MKKILAIALALVLVLGLFAGCGKDPVDPNTPENPGTEKPGTETPEVEQVVLKQAEYNTTT